MDIYSLPEIKKLLLRHGFYTSKSLGQNFLTAGWVPLKISEAAGLNKDKPVFEIGPGIGSLTRVISDNSKKTVTVEIDKNLIPILNETLEGRENVRVINADILKTDIKKLCAENFGDEKPALCSNLPYYITAPVIVRVLESGAFETAVFMVQKEVAERICAKPGSSEYGAFSIFVNYHSDPAICFQVPSECFFPRPKVDSAVIRLNIKNRKYGCDFDEALFFKIVRASFSKRRKTLLNGLHPAFSDRITKESMAKIIESVGFEQNIRGEKLSIQDFIKISKAVYKTLNSTQ